MFPSLEVASQIATIIACVPLLVALGFTLNDRFKSDSDPPDDLL